MAAPKRTPFQIARDRAEIARLYLQGKFQHEIASTINSDPDRDYTLTQPMISYDLKAVQDDWRDSAVRDFDAAKAEAIAKIDELERTYWAAWLASRETKERTIQEQIVATTARTKAVIHKEEQVGDPRFLAGVQWCIDRRCKLMGLDAPLKIAPTDPSGQKEYDADSRAAFQAELRDRLTRLAANNRPPGIPDDPGEPGERSEG